MGNFKQNKGFDKFGGGRRGGGFNDRGQERPGMHKAVCDKCGKECEVPFRPSGDKPVYCNDCFRDKRAGDSRSPMGGRGFNRFSRKEGADRFSQSSQNSSATQVNQQFEMINQKLDRILKSLTPVAPVVAKEEKKAKDKVKPVAKIKPKPKKKK